MSFTIKRWNGLITTANINPQPVVYIVPDLNLLSFAQANNNTLLVKIEGTGLPYDNKQILASIMPSSDGPSNCRPNFFKETGLYAIILDSVWFGQPEGDDLGFLTVLGLTVVDGVMTDGNSSSDNAPKNAVMASKGFMDSDGNINMDMFIIGLSFAIFVIVMAYIYYDRKKFMQHIKRK